MQGDPAIISMLNDVLTSELTAINQYFIHAKMCSNWGYGRLAAHSRDESIEEMKHADEIIERILFFEGVPNMQRLNPVRVGETVAEQFQLDLELEYEAAKRFNAGITACAASGDSPTVTISGSVKQMAGMPRLSQTRLCPATISATISPCAMAR